MRAIPKEREDGGGFTLLEMLVVLLLTGMVAAILFQGLGQVLRIEGRRSTQLHESRQGEMYVQWFRQCINGLLPGYPDGENRFRGTAREMRGRSLFPLDVASEAVLPIRWQLRFDPGSGRTQLRYGGADHGPVVLSWQGNSGRFVYFDFEGGAHDSWPPYSGTWPQLPASILLDNGVRDEPLVVVAAPRGPQQPLPRPRDLRE